MTEPNLVHEALSHTNGKENGVGIPTAGVKTTARYTKNNSKPEHFSLMPQASPKRCFCFLLPQLGFSSSNKVLAGFAYPHSQAGLLRDSRLRIFPLKYSPAFFNISEDFSGIAASEFCTRQAYSSTFIASKLLHPQAWRQAHTDHAAQPRKKASLRPGRLRGRGQL